ADKNDRDCHFRARATGNLTTLGGIYWKSGGPGRPRELAAKSLVPIICLRPTPPARPMNRLVLALVAALLAAAPLVAVDPRELKPGLVAGYSDDPKTPSATRYRIEPAIAFTMPANDRSFPGRASVSWSGYLYVVTPGKYTFTATVQGGDFSLMLTPPEAEALT